MLADCSKKSFANMQCKFFCCQYQWEALQGGVKGAIVGSSTRIQNPTNFARIVSKKINITKLCIVRPGDRVSLKRIWFNKPQCIESSSFVIFIKMLV